ncbi:MAG: hypothetical protein JSS29_08815 [Proteobacteria bacterium]|nr:hypothetical protein [Pseudomonadota bacterium]
MARVSDTGSIERVFGWRAGLRRELAVLLLLKAAALALLWWMFFSPAHRAPVDAAAAGRHLALEAPPAPASGDGS